jgi:hypothetical protein
MTIPLLSPSYNSRVPNAFLAEEVMRNYVDLLLFPCKFAGILNLTDIMFHHAKFGAVVRKYIKNKQTEKQTYTILHTERYYI